jgi:hypothetical protein
LQTLKVPLNYYIGSLSIEHSPTALAKVGIFTGIVTGWGLLLTNVFYGLYGKKRRDFVN